jgi:hypothetical protein
MSWYSAVQLDQLTRSRESFYLDHRPLLQMLQKKNRIKYNSKGARKAWELNAANTATLRSIGKFATIAATENGDPIRAALDWSDVAAYAAVSGQEVERQGTPGSMESGTIDLIRTRSFSQLETDFKEKFAIQLFDGDGAVLNGAQGRTLYGITQSVLQTNTTGTYAGVSRVTYTDWRPTAMDGATAGATSSWATDCWQVVDKAQRDATHPYMGKQVAPSLLIGTKNNNNTLINRGLTQNTNVGASVDGIKSIMGMQLAFDETVASGSLFLLAPEVWALESVLPTLFQIYYRDELPENVNPKDEVMVIRFHGALVNESPRHQALIYNAT